MARRFCGDLAAYILGRDMLRNGIKDMWRRHSAATHEAGHALIIAAHGHAIHQVEVSNDRDLWGGHVIAPPYDMTGAVSIDFADLQATAVYMCATAGGYMGERTLGRETGMAAHEMSVIFYLCKLIEIHHGISRTAALRATLSECERIINDNRTIGERVAATLMAQATIETVEAAELFAGIKRATAQDWLNAARGSPPEYPEAEEMLRVADAFAEIAAMVYA